MASIKDKIRALRALLRDDALADSILAHLDAKEKELKLAGIATAYKSNGTDGDGDYLGDITVEAFGDLMADILEDILVPVTLAQGPLQRALPYRTDSESKTKEIELRVADQARDIRQLVAQVKALGGDVPDAATDTGFFGFLTAGGATVI